MTNSTNFVTGTQVTKEWLNDVDALVFGIPEPAGASLVGYMPSGVGAVATTVQGELDSHTVNLWRYLTLAQIVDAQSNAGLIDCTAALQAAANSGQKIIAPAGTYLFSSIALTGLGTAFLYISGDGPKTILKTTAAANTAFILGATGVGIEGIVLENLLLQGNSTNTGGIQFGSSTTYAAYIKLKNIIIQGFTKVSGFGIGIGSVQELDCENVILRNNYDNVVKLNGGYCTSATFRGKAGYIGLATHRGIDLTQPVQNLSCFDTVIESNAYEAIYSAGVASIVTVQNCYIEANATTGGSAEIVMTGGATLTQSGTLVLKDNWFSDISSAVKNVSLDWAWNCDISGNAGLLKNGGILTTANTSAHFAYNNMVSSGMTGINPDTVYGALLGNISWDDYSALTGYTSKRTAQTISGVSTVGYTATARGETAPVASGVASPLFIMPGHGKYEVICWWDASADINYMASATILSMRGLDQRVSNQSNGSVMQITLTAGGVVNATQLSGSSVPISWSYLRIR